MKQVHPRSQTTAILYQEPTQAEMTSPKPSMGKGALIVCFSVVIACTYSVCKQISTDTSNYTAQASNKDQK